MLDKATVSPPQAEVQLAGQHFLLLRRGDQADRIELRDRNRVIMFAIEISERGPVLRFEGSELTVQSTGELRLVAQDLVLRGEQSLSIQTGGDINVTAGGDLHSRARAQNITAELGDVRVRANDDVRIDGERVLVNC